MQPENFFQLSQLHLQIEELDVFVLLEVLLAENQHVVLLVKATREDRIVAKKAVIVLVNKVWDRITIEV